MRRDNCTFIVRPLNFTNFKFVIFYLICMLSFLQLSFASLNFANLGVQSHSRYNCQLTHINHGLYVASLCLGTVGADNPKITDHYEVVEWGVM